MTQTAETTEGLVHFGDFQYPKEIVLVIDSLYDDGNDVQAEDLLDFLDGMGEENVLYFAELLSQESIPKTESSGSSQLVLFASQQLVNSELSFA